MNTRGIVITTRSYSREQSGDKMTRKDTPKERKKETGPQKETSRLRTFAEVSYAHDLMVGILAGDVSCIKLRVPPEVLENMRAATDVLCWVLHHEHNDAFEKNLNRLKEATESAGYEMKPINRKVH